MNTQQTVPSFETFATPMITFNKIALEYTEKLVEMSFSVLRKQADVALAGWNEALAVKTPEQGKDYLTHQGEVARDVVNGYVADAKAVAKLNQEVASDVRKAVEEGFAKATKQAV